MRYIYLDETQNENFIGYGAFASDYEINSDIIDEALEDLRQDIDIHNKETSRYDNETIKRGYFHASSDSKNGHSHFCNKLNKELIGVFTAELFIKNYKADTADNIYKLASSLCTLHALHTYETIKLIFENREGLNKEKIEIAFDELYKDMLKSVYQQPALPSFFPKLEYEIKSKQEPGIQCVDFLLWTVQRELMGNGDWYNRLKFNWGTKSHTQSNDWTNYHLSFKKDLPSKKLYYEYKDIPKESDKIVSHDMLANFFFYAVKVINYYSINGLPEHLLHFRRKLDNVYNNRLDKNYKYYVEDLIELYLYFFDMVPLIKEDVPKKDKEFLLLSKKYLGLALRVDLIQGIRTKIYLIRCRDTYLEKQPTIFE